MAEIIRSGAFLQQCWSIHPLCVTVRRVSDDRTVVLACSACRSAHRLTLATVVSKASSAQGAKVQDPEEEQGSGGTLLGACLTAHHRSVTLSTMDVFQDFVLLRCADCRRHYELTISSFETHQK
jgi:hypothetical protein